MNSVRLIIVSFFISAVGHSQAFNSFRQDTIEILNDEKWFGAAVDEGDKMPFKNGYKLNLYGDCKGNQAAPLLLSSKGRFIWCEDPFAFSIQEKRIIFSGKYPSLQLVQEGSNLREAYLLAAKKFFPPSGQNIEKGFIETPQYNTWIELKYNQNQAGIIKYAEDIIQNGLPAGILMIDDNWFAAYGNFEFRKDRFADPAGMISQLHRMGFKVMLWVSPFISPDSEIFRTLAEKGLLVMRKRKGPDSANNFEPAVIEWWNGYSASIDLTNPAAVQWFVSNLEQLKKVYGIDGFKFDAGDPEFYTAGDLVFHQENIKPNDITEDWNRLGLTNSFNEYRASWKMGNQPLIQRLRDKKHNWEDLNKIIPAMTIAGLLGYGAACPDMIGGGEFQSFGEKDSIDQKLVVRSAQLQSLMPMMQFSIAPWRILDPPKFQAIKKAVETRRQFLPLIQSLIKRFAQTGEPVVRSMEYVFPGRGFSSCNDQFMLGDSILVAPALTALDSRMIRFPVGKWKAYNGMIIKGPVTREMEIPMEDLAWFRLVR